MDIYHIREVYENKSSGHINVKDKYLYRQPLASDEEIDRANPRSTDSVLMALRLSLTEAISVMEMINQARMSRYSSLTQFHYIIVLEHE